MTRHLHVAMIGVLLCACCLYAAVSAVSGALNPVLKSVGNLDKLHHVTKECRTRDEALVSQNPKCFSKQCMRVILDNEIDIDKTSKLLQIAKKGMATRSKDGIGGPTIMDINTGYIRDPNGLDNLFALENKIITESDFQTYSDVIHRLKSLIENNFDIEDVFFTAPTFITRLDGRGEWQPNEIHDEYWHVHTDMNNTNHYQYSGLLYLNTYGEDFTGGRLVFVDADDEITPTHIVEPRAGRVALFSSGQENPHYVERLTSGQRFVLAFWFTCMPSKQFEIFLDGQAHLTFSEKVGKQFNARVKKSSEL